MYNNSENPVGTEDTKVKVKPGPKDRTKLFHIYNPVSGSIYQLDMRKLKMWMDMDDLSMNMSNDAQMMAAVNALSLEEKNNVFSIMGLETKPFPFEINPWKGAASVDMSFRVLAERTRDGDGFEDPVQELIDDKIFYADEYHTIASQGLMGVNPNTIFPVKTILGIGKGFLTETPMEEGQEYPVYDMYLGKGSLSKTRILLDDHGYPSSIVIKYPFKESPYWNFFIEVTLALPEFAQKIVLGDIPRTQGLFEFFLKEGYAVRGLSLNRFTWKKGGNLIEYNITSKHLYQSFIMIRKANGDTSIDAKYALGVELTERMKAVGVWEEVLYQRARRHQDDAVARIDSKDKVKTALFLEQAIELYAQCDYLHREEALAHKLFCRWLLSRMAGHLKNEKLRVHHLRTVFSELAELHDWQHFEKFIKLLLMQEKELPMAVIQDYLPLPEMDKDFFVEEDTYKRLLGLWDETMNEKSQAPIGEDKAEWHYKTAQIASQIGLKDTARRHLILFFRTASEDIQRQKWMLEGKEQIHDFAKNLGALEAYHLFARKMAAHAGHQRTHRNLNDMRVVERKRYRWDIISWSMAEARWASHVAYMSAGKKGQDEKVQQFYAQAYNALNDAVMHIDYSEDYTAEQLEYMAEGFVSMASVGYGLQDQNLLNFVFDQLEALWISTPSFDIYKIIHVLYDNADQKKMADYLIDEWLKAFEGRMFEKEDLFALGEVYYTAESYEDAAKAYNLILKKHGKELTLTEANLIYEQFKRMRAFSYTDAIIMEEGIYEWIDGYKKEQMLYIDEIETIFPYIRAMREV